ncbi:MAG: sugar phosphate isomerase/epimerase family protein [Planctomycetia bacterium]|nr:sugar phosphate isomerase/epimerase family protein [Planctomycetia bacterium]
MKNQWSRRQLLGSALLGATAFALPGQSEGKDAEKFVKSKDFKGNIRQGVSRWCFGKIPLDELCRSCKDMGITGIDLVKPDDWEAVKKNGMEVSMGSLPGVNIPDGINDKANHEKVIAVYEKYIPIAAELGIPNLISLSGNRRDIDPETGMKNCCAALKKIMPLAEKYKITINMELLNAKDHKDYMCDNTLWGVELCKMVGSPRFKLLYDIYHMQRMEGDIIYTIRTYNEFFGHYHTAGCPGRMDLDDQQELYYPPIMKAILETGFKGFVSHEFRAKNGLKSLYDAVCLCDV